MAARSLSRPACTIEGHDAGDMVLMCRALRHELWDLQGLPKGGSSLIWDLKAVRDAGLRCRHWRKRAMQAARGVGLAGAGTAFLLAEMKGCMR